MRFAKTLIVAVACVLSATGAQAAKHPLYKEPKEMSWAQDGIFGKFDRAQLQRGFQVYKEACAACHALSLVPFRTLEDIGFTPEEVKKIAAEYEVADIDDVGEPIMRPATPADAKPKPFANERAARAANNNAYPPDLSLIIKARADGQRYVYSLLTGYGQEPPAAFVNAEGKTEQLKIDEALNYNPYFPTIAIAMAQPLSDDQVAYADGTAATKSQMAQDVVAFLSWAAEPKMEARKQMGVGVMIFLAILIILSFASYKKVWADVKKA
jgi:ubiquinol-cytochrome c reductase cytochrome c1 subunit